MPFQSEAQRRFLWANHPEIAERWAHEHPGQKNLPRHKRKVKRKKKRALHKHRAAKRLSRSGPARRKRGSKRRKR